LGLILSVFPTDYDWPFFLAVLIGVLVFFVNAYSLRVEVKQFLDS
jgi:hypothetical protein